MGGSWWEDSSQPEAKLWLPWDGRGELRSPTPEKLGSAVPGPLSFPGVDTRPSRRSGPGGLRWVQSRHLRYAHEWVLPVWAIPLLWGVLRREPLVGREVGLILLEVEAIGSAH